MAYRLINHAGCWKNVSSWCEMNNYIMSEPFQNFFIHVLHVFLSL